MNGGVERILDLAFGQGGNESNHLGAGWSGDEPGRRWMIGPASELWLNHPGAGHDLILELDTELMDGPDGRTTQRLVVGVRNVGIAQIAMRRPGTVGFHIPAGLAAAPGPVRLMFVHPDFRRPMDLRGGSDDRQLSFAPRRLRLSRVLPRPAPPPAAPLPPEQLMTRFESLGDNCEFGLAQRRVGAEPLGLLRFSYIELFQLLRALRSGFAGLGDPGATRVSTEGPDSEYIVRDANYAITYHTFQSPEHLSLEAVTAQQATRLAFLRRKLLEDIVNGEKILVVRRGDTLRPEEVLPLYTALNDRGRAWLLWIVPADPAHPSGTVEMLLPGLLRGYVDRLAPNDNAHDLSLEAWLAVCAAAWRAAGRAVEPDGRG